MIPKFVSPDNPFPLPQIQLPFQHLYLLVKHVSSQTLSADFLISVTGNSFDLISPKALVCVILESSLSLTPASTPLANSVSHTFKVKSDVNSILPCPLLPLRTKSPSFLSWIRATAPICCLCPGPLPVFLENRVMLSKSGWMPLFCSKPCSDFPFHSEQKPNSLPWATRSYTVCPSPPQLISDLISCSSLSLPLLTCCSVNTPWVPLFQGLSTWYSLGLKRLPLDLHRALSLPLFLHLLIRETFPHPPI